MSRPLTEGELNVLRIIQDGYGQQNTADDVFFTDQDEASIFVKAKDGTSPMCAVLTNLAAWRAEGVIESDEVLRREWLGL